MFAGVAELWEDSFVFFAFSCCIWNCLGCESVVFWVLVFFRGLGFVVFQKTTQRLHFNSQIKPINILLNIEEYYFSYY